MSSATCPTCGADPLTVGVMDGHLCLECKRREGIDEATFVDRDFGVGVPGIIAEECYKLRDALHTQKFDIVNVRMFSKLDLEDRIRVLLDDALIQLMRDEINGEEAEQKFLEGLIMLRVARRLEAK